jgi:hypothetical protein
MPLSGLLLGLIDIAITVVVMLLIGLIAKWVWDKFLGGTPAQVQTLYIAIVALIALYMLAAMLLGLPAPFHLIR